VDAGFPELLMIEEGGLDIQKSPEYAKTTLIYPSIDIRRVE
jgi:hypothetical protein